MASIFSRILSGELPGHFVWKDEKCFAIMTIQPIRAGHVILIPNAEVDHWDNVEPATAAHLMQVAQKIARGIKAVFPCERVGMTIIGLEVPHTHIHLLPIDTMGDLDFKFAKALPQDQLASAAGKIAQALINLGHSQAVVQ